MKEFLDTREVAELTGLSQSTLEKWRLRNDRIPYIKAGRVVRYSVAEVRTWMHARRVLSTSALQLESTRCITASSKPE